MTIYVFTAHGEKTTTAYSKIEALTARINSELRGCSLAESSRVAMNRMVEGTNTMMAHLYNAEYGDHLGTVRVAELT